MSRSKDRADRIRSEVPIIEVLAAYGYAVSIDGGREQQFSCDLHGDGSDSKPSARVYPDSNQWYCFACSTSRDAIQTVREKEGLDFRTACDQLEKRFHLPALPWTQDEESKPELDFDFNARAPTAADASLRVAALLKSITGERSVPLPELLRLWQAHDRLALFLEHGSDTLLEDFLSLRDRVVQTIRANVRL